VDERGASIVKNLCRLKPICKTRKVTFQVGAFRGTGQFCFHGRHFDEDFRSTAPELLQQATAVCGEAASEAGKGFYSRNWLASICRAADIPSLMR